MDDDAAATAAEFDWLCSRQFRNLPLFDVLAKKWLSRERATSKAEALAGGVPAVDRHDGPGYVAADR